MKQLMGFLLTGLLLLTACQRRTADPGPGVKPPVVAAPAVSAAPAPAQPPSALPAAPTVMDKPKPKGPLAALCFGPSGSLTQYITPGSPPLPGRSRACPALLPLARQALPGRPDYYQEYGPDTEEIGQLEAHNWDLLPPAVRTTLPPRLQTYFATVQLDDGTALIRLEARLTGWIVTGISLPANAKSPGRGRSVPEGVGGGKNVTGAIAMRMGGRVCVSLLEHERHCQEVVYCLAVTNSPYVAPLMYEPKAVVEVSRCCI